MSHRPRRVIILGSTGSIGTQTVDVLEHLNAASPGAWRVVGLAAGTDAGALAAQAQRLGVTELALASENPGAPPRGARLRCGPGAAETLVREVEADIVVASIVGSAGIRSTIAALELGRDVALANKETLVAAGATAVRTARTSGARILPVDSEHSGVWQCLPGWPATPCAAGGQIRRVILTASGGALRDADTETYHAATPAEALAHPTWNMGAKVTVDSATLMNKALELIEAHWLFGLGNDRLGVLIHPQSAVHALVEMTDGAVLAQLGTADMRTAIQAALTWPGRAAPPAPRLDLTAGLTFQEPDPHRHAALDLARRVIEAGGTTGAVLTAANEEAVAAFLAGSVPLGQVVGLSAGALEAIGEGGCPADLERVFEADAAARRYVQDRVRESTGPAVHRRGPAGR